MHGFYSNEQRGGARTTSVLRALSDKPLRHVDPEYKAKVTCRAIQARGRHPLRRVPDLPTAEAVGGNVPTGEIKRTGQSDGPTHAKQRYSRNAKGPSANGRHEAALTGGTATRPDSPGRPARSWRALEPAR